MKKVLIALVVVLAVAFSAPVMAKEKMGSVGLSFNLPYEISDIRRALRARFDPADPQ